MITVITPTIASRKELLAECVKSVKAQTVPVKHTIILDDTQQGAPAIRNAAVAAATSDWVLFLDDDDLLKPEHIAKIEPFADSADVIITWPDYLGFPVQPQWLWKEFDPAILDEWCPWGQCAAVRREIYLAVGGQPDGVVFEDWALWKRLRDGGARFRIVPEILWTHRWHNQQRTITDMTEYHQGSRKLT